jgi:hypothetical protein
MGEARGTGDAIIDSRAKARARTAENSATRGLPRLAEIESRSNG